MTIFLSVCAFIATIAIVKIALESEKIRETLEDMVQEMDSVANILMAMKNLTDEEAE